MADSKITALTAISTVDPAADPLVIVDVSDTSMAASGTTKKATINQLLGASGTATLASATVTGNLTAAAVIPSGSTVPTNGLYLPTANNLGFAYNSTLGMTLNSTGLGVGASPNISASGKALTISGAFTRSRLELQNTDGGTAGVTCGTISWFNGSNAIADITGATNSGSATLGSLAFSTGGSPRLTIDSSGNVISNVTGTAPTLATNSQMVFNLTSNTNLRISVRGTDGTTRTANITLA